MAGLVDFGEGIENDFLAASVHLKLTDVLAKGDMIHKGPGDVVAHDPNLELKTYSSRTGGRFASKFAGFKSPQRLFRIIPLTKIYTEKPAFQICWH